MQQNAVVERRSGSLAQIDHLVDARNKTLRLYYELAAMQPFVPTRKDVMKTLQLFCESLIDYTASAHFQLYRFIDERKERRQAVLDIANEVYPSIVDITQRILSFNDKYDCEDHCENMSGLAKDLSRLGESLAERIDQEDKVIEALRQSR